MTNPESAARRPWMQISIRGLLLLTTFVAVFFGWRQWSQGPGRRQQEAMAEIWKFGDRFETEPHDPDWMERWLGIIRPRRVRALHLGTGEFGALAHARELLPETLHLRYDDLTPHVMEQVARIESLRSLRIEGCGSDFGGFRGLQGRVPRASLFMPLRRLPRLETIQIECTSFEPSALAELRHLPQLAELRFNEAELGYDGFVALSGCHRLKSLSVQGERIEPRFLADLRDLPELQSLAITSEPSDAAVAALDRFPKLADLPWPTLSGIGDESLRWICRRFRPLRLCLGPARVTDAGLAALQELPDLEVLELRQIEITERGLRTVGALSRLTSLTLRDVKVTDAGLMQLCPLKGLQSLAIHGPQVSPDGFYRLSKEFPRHACYLEDSGYYLIGPRTERVLAARSGL